MEGKAGHDNILNCTAGLYLLSLVKNINEMRHISLIYLKPLVSFFHLKQTDFLKNHLFALDFPQKNLFQNNSLH